MSLYQVDKVVKQLTHNEDPGPFQRFMQDSAAFLADFKLTDEERQALLDRDAPKLYSMGVHPFILQMFAARTSGEDPMTFMPKYIQMLQPLGHPSYET